MVTDYMTMYVQVTTAWRRTWSRLCRLFVRQLPSECWTYQTDSLWTEGGSGSYGFSSMLVYISRKNGAFFQDYGRVLHDQAIYGVKPEGKLSVEYTYETFSFPTERLTTLQTELYYI